MSETIWTQAGPLEIEAADPAPKTSAPFPPKLEIPSEYRAKVEQVFGDETAHRENVWGWPIPRTCNGGKLE